MARKGKKELPIKQNVNSSEPQYDTEREERMKDAGWTQSELDQYPQLTTAQMSYLHERGFTPENSTRRDGNFMYYGQQLVDAQQQAGLEGRELTPQEQDLAYLASPATTPEEALMIDQSRRMMYARYGEMTGELPQGTYDATRFDICQEMGYQPTMESMAFPNKIPEGVKGLSSDQVPRLSNEFVKPDYSQVPKPTQDYSVSTEHRGLSDPKAPGYQAMMQSLQTEAESEESSVRRSFVRGMMAGAVASQRMHMQERGDQTLGKQSAEPDGLSEKVAERFAKHPELRDARVETKEDKLLTLVSGENLNAQKQAGMDDPQMG